MTSRRTGRFQTSSRVFVAAAAAWIAGAVSASAGVTQDVQLVGLPFMYEALFATGNCSNVKLDARAFARAARLYHLSPDDFRPDGPLGATVSSLDAEDRVRLADDRDAFCSMSRLSFAVPYGILVDLGPVVPRSVFPTIP